MVYKDLIDKLGKVVSDYSLLLRVDGNMVAIEGKFLKDEVLNKIQRLLQLYGECEWWIYPSEVIECGVMYKIKIFK